VGRGDKMKFFVIVNPHPALFFIVLSTPHSNSRKYP
jgi:hypothetical protein